MMPSSYTTICILIGLHTFPDALYACPGTLYLFFNIYMRFQTLYMRFQTLYVCFPDTLWAGPMGQARALTFPAETSKKTRPGFWGCVYIRFCVQMGVVRCRPAWESPILDDPTSQFTHSLTCLPTHPSRYSRIYDAGDIRND